MTTSRSMPFSLQTASMLCPMDALIVFKGRGLDAGGCRKTCWPYPLVSSPCFLLPLPLLREPELLFNVYLKIRLRDLRDGDADAPRGLVFKQNVFALDPLDA